MSSGVLVVDKPEGMTSQGVCSFVRRLTGIRRVGHGGTLDPLATGVLPVFIGNATRVIEYMSEKDDPQAKKYRAAMRLGVSTDTQDMTGRVLSEVPAGYAFPDRAAVEAVLKSFEGEGEQTPPAYSAVKYKGRKLYDYARKGAELPEGAIKSRRIVVSGIELLRYEVVGESTVGAAVYAPVDGVAACGFAEAEFEITCSGGLYVRTICHDAGERLGCGAAMSALRRLKSGPYLIEDSVTIAALEEAAARGGAETLPLLPADSAVSGLPKLILPADEARRFTAGMRIKVDDGASDSAVAVYRENIQSAAFIGIGMIENGTVCPHKVLV
ncbi:MAG: tRNA pseudouridine(55) synthase TruB [Clostridiales Family XIII bacterium]|jgi:tRNA pseudouridine55 synthase|nr:tRNA pseudouridine(55) synthase TruB [Clostridiales Family XIII bacterium]